jgi:hypothetical protein
MVSEPHIIKHYVLMNRDAFHEHTYPLSAMCTRWLITGFRLACIRHAYQSRAV